MANDTYQLVIAGHTAGEFWENVLHFRNELTNGPNPVQNAGELIFQFQSVAEDALADCLATDCSITGYKCKRINNGGGPYVMKPQTAVPGTVTGTSATSAAAQLLTAPFTRASKWFTGKIFLPSVPESALTGNTLSTPQIALLQAFIDLLKLGFDGDAGHWDYVIWSKDVALPFLPFDVNVSAKIGIQRRRLTPVM